MKTEHAIDWGKTAAEIEKDYTAKCLRIEQLEAENAALREDAERWKLASSSPMFGISNWCEFGHRISYGESAEKLIDAARSQP